MTKQNVFLYVQINAQIHSTALFFQSDIMSFSTTAKTLGFYFRDDIRIDLYVQGICHKACIDISSICHLLCIDATKTFASVFVLPNLYYCNFFSYGSPMFIQEILQKVYSSSARLIFQSHKQNHMSEFSKQRMPQYGILCLLNSDILLHP